MLDKMYEAVIREKALESLRAQLESDNPPVCACSYFIPRLRKGNKLILLPFDVLVRLSAKPSRGNGGLRQE